MTFANAMLGGWSIPIVEGAFWYAKRYRLTLAGERLRAELLAQ